MSYKMTVYKKSKGCPNCSVFDRITPTLKTRYPEVEWDYVVIDPDSDTNPELPEFVKSFPTSVFTKDGEELFTMAGYDGVAKKMAAILNQ